MYNLYVQVNFGLKVGCFSELKVTILQATDSTAVLLLKNM